MIKAFPIPPGADKVSERAIKAFQERLGHLIISKEEIQFIIDGIMKAQAPRDAERKRKAEEKAAERERQRQLKAQYRRQLS